MRANALVILLAFSGCYVAPPGEAEPVLDAGTAFVAEGSGSVEHPDAGCGERDASYRCCSNGSPRVLTDAGTLGCAW